MARRSAECPVQGSLGLELERLMVPASGPVVEPEAPRKPAPRPTVEVQTLPVAPAPPEALPPALPSVEAVVQVHLDPDQHAWRSSVMVVALGGELLDHREGEGQIQLRESTDPEAKSPVVLPGDYDLLGFAVDQGLAFLEAMDLPEGSRAVLEASTHANATLSGRLRDWIREGSFDPGARRRFPYAHEAWGRVAPKLWPAVGQPLAKIRWVF